MRRHELTDEQWDRIKHHFALWGGVGRPPREHRPIVNAIFWLVRVGCAWRDLPEERYGPWETVYCRFQRWLRDGTWQRVIDDLHSELAAEGLLDHSLWCADSTIVRAHRSAAGARVRGGAAR
jgi:transposase